MTKISRIEMILGIIGLAVFICPLTWAPSIANTANTDNQNNHDAAPISESIHLIKADGVKSLGQLIREQSAVTIPDRPISKFSFIVDSTHDTLIFPANDFQPPGFELGIAPGDDKEFKLPRLPINAPDALNFFLTKTEGVCNFVVYIEFYPRR